MSSNQGDSDAALLRRLAEDAIEDLLSTPRDVRRQEIEEDHGGCGTVAEEMRAIIDAGLAKHGRKRAAEIRELIEKERQTPPLLLRAMSIDEKRALYARVVNSNIELTAAARNGRELTDGDLDTHLEAWLALGIIDRDGTLQ